MLMMHSSWRKLFHLNLKSGEIDTEKIKLSKLMKRSGINKFDKIILGLLIGAISIYAFRKYFTRKAENKI
jgi:hypothetical protein